jgi:quinolinate synthase
MAETAKILAPEKKVLLPDLMAGCSLAESCNPDDFRKFMEEIQEEQLSHMLIPQPR